MKRLITRIGHMAAFAGLWFSFAAYGADANSSATAGSNGGRTGTAVATAGYEGDFGFARTDSNSGRVNTARGVAVGVDNDGVSLSLSNALATQHGPAIATNYNLSIGRDGRVSSSFGASVANGPVHREASAGGRTATTANGGGAVSEASGRTDRFGSVEARSEAHDSGVRRGSLARGSHEPRTVRRGFRDGLGIRLANGSRPVGFAGR